MTKDRPKKSEMLEVRVSYETKQKLQAKARHESRFVSDIVRAQIHAYLKQPEHKSYQRLLSMFRKPKAIILGFLGASLMTLSMFTGATAENVSLEIDGAFTQTFDEEPLSIRTRTFTTEVLMDEEGGTIQFGPTASLIITLTTNPVRVDGGGSKGVLISLVVAEQLDGDQRIIAEPKLKAAYGEIAKIQIGGELGERFELSILPSLKLEQD